MTNEEPNETQSIPEKKHILNCLPIQDQISFFFGEKVFEGNFCNFFLLSCKVVSEKNQKKKSIPYTAFFNIR